jgi:hypothetical protein
VCILETVALLISVYDICVGRPSRAPSVFFHPHGGGRFSFSVLGHALCTSHVGAHHLDAPKKCQGWFIECAAAAGLCRVLCSFGYKEILRQYPYVFVVGESVLFCAGVTWHVDRCEVSRVWRACAVPLASLRLRAFPLYSQINEIYKDTYMY